MAKRKILILAANPKNSSLRRLDREVRDIEAGMKRSKLREEFEIVTQLALRTGDIQRALLDEQPAIVHFAGQGAGANGLIVEDKNGKAKLVSTQALARLFKFFKDEVECVVLNACYSEEQAEAIREHIGYVVGVDDEITNRQAIQFATGFYDALGAGRSYEDAAEMGRITISLDDDSDVIKRKKTRNIILANIGFAFLLVFVRSLGWFQSQELWIYDRLVWNSPYEEVDDRIAIIGIDRTSLEDLYDSPDWNTKVISDLKLSKIISGLIQHQENEKKPDIIGIDVARDDPKSDTPDAGDFNNELQDQIVEENDTVITACAWTGEYGVKPIRHSETGKLAIRGFTRLPNDNEEFLSNKDKATPMIRRQLLAVEGLLSSKDHKSECQTEESFSYKIALRFLKNKKVISDDQEENWQEHLRTNDAAERISINDVILDRIYSRTGGYQTIDSQGEQILLNYRNIKGNLPKSGFNSIDAVDFLKCYTDLKQCSEADADILKKADIVLIGYVGEESGDKFNTPLGYLHGVEIHAHTISYILSTVKPDYAQGKYKISKIKVLSPNVEDFYMILFGLGGSLIALYANQRLNTKILISTSTIVIVALIVSVTILFTSYLAFNSIGLWLPAFPWILSFTSSISLTIMIKKYQVQKEE